MFFVRCEGGDFRPNTLALQYRSSSSRLHLAESAQTLYGIDFMPSSRKRADIVWYRLHRHLTESAQILYGKENLYIIEYKNWNKDGTLPCWPFKPGSKGSYLLTKTFPSWRSPFNFEVDIFDGDRFLFDRRLILFEG